MSPEPDSATRRRDTVDPESPWLGLRSFTEDTRAYFFGRDAELQDLFERVVHKPLTVLFGQSGLGKTSLLQAGLVPRLREAGYLPVPLRLDHSPRALDPERQMLIAFRNVLLHTMRITLRGVVAEVPIAMRGNDPMVQSALSKFGYEHLKFPQDVESLWLLLHDPSYGFVSTADGAPAVRPVFIFDQFEEIFTLGERPERRDASLAFRDTLACLVENRPPAALRARLDNDDDLAERLAYPARPAKFLLTLREDFLHVLERWRRQMPSLMDNRMELRLLTGPQALQAVVEPGRMRGPDRPPIVSEDTGAAIVRFVAGAKDDIPLAEIDAVPPLLSLICAELNARRFDPDGKAAGETVRPEQLQGQSADILEAFYAGAFADVPEAARELVENRLLSADGFRESLALDTAHRVLEMAGVTPTEARAALGTLVNRRLLVVEERGGVRRVELTHDVLTGVARASRDRWRERQAAAALEKADQERLFQQDADQRRIAAMEAALKAGADTEEMARRATCVRYEAEALVERIVAHLRDKLGPLGQLPLLDEVSAYLQAHREGAGGQHESVETLQRWCDSLRHQARFAVTKGDFAGALTTLQGARAIAGQLFRQDPAAPARRDTLAILWELTGNARRAMRDHPGALRAYERTVAFRRVLASEDPADPRRRHDLSVGLEKVGNIHVVLNQLPPAMEVYNEADALREILVAEEPANLSRRRDRWVILYKIGQTRCVAGDLPSARDYLGRAAALLEDLHRLDPAHPGWLRDLAATYLQLGAVLSASRDFAGSLDCHRRGLALAEDLVARLPGNVEARTTQVSMLTQIGSTLARRSDPALREEGLALLHRAGILRKELATGEAAPPTRPNPAG